MSDIVPAKKTAGAWVKEWVNDVHKAIAPPEQPAATVSYTKSAGSTLAQYLGGATIGSLLGATHAKWGLETRFGDIDGWIAGLGALFSVGLSKWSPELAAAARKAGNDSWVIWTFRKGYQIVKHSPLEGGSAPMHRSAPAASATMQGERGAHKEDRIERAAREVNL